MRPLLCLLRCLFIVALLPSFARADELDLTPRSRRTNKPSSLVLRAEGGSAFAPYGFVGGCLSYLSESQFEFELGAGAGFPGVQFGIAARRLFGENGSFFATELALAGNNRVNRGADDANPLLNVDAQKSRSSLWTSLGFGFEQRQDNFSLGIIGSIVITTASLTPHFSIHGGIGFGFF